MNIEKRVENMENNFKDFLSVYQQREQVTSDGLITVTNQVNKIKEERGMSLNNENNATLLSQVQGIGEKMVILEQKVLELSKENQV
jgi:hypothetical protein